MRLCQCVPAYSVALRNSNSNSNSTRIESNFDSSISTTDHQLDSKISSTLNSLIKNSNSHKHFLNDRPLLDGWPSPIRDNDCDDDWTWNYRDCSHEVKLYGPRYRTVLFHPGWSNGTAAVRGTKPLLSPTQNGFGAYYWEIDVSHRVFGTSLMFGVGTKNADLHEYSFTNILGKDENSWCLNHKGLAWHNGECTQFTDAFDENTPTTIGIVLDWKRDGGTLEYYKDGKYLGVAFRQLSSTLETNSRGDDEKSKFLYPMIASTAARTEMCLVRTRKSTEKLTLQDRCLYEIAKNVKSVWGVEQLELPNALKAAIRRKLILMQS